MKQMTVRQAAKALQQLGFEQVRHRGGHRQYKRGSQLITLAGAHPGKRAHANVVRFIERQRAQLDRD